MNPRRAKNQMSVTATRSVERGLKKESADMGKAWEESIQKLLRVNKKRWLWIRIPTPLPKHLAKLLGKGWPDFFCVGRPGSDRQGIILIIEAKTGKGKAKPMQELWIQALLLVPGVRGGVFYPHQREELVELIGDEIT